MSEVAIKMGESPSVECIASYFEADLEQVTACIGLQKPVVMSEVVIKMGESPLLSVYSFPFESDL